MATNIGEFGSDTSGQEFSDDEDLATGLDNAREAFQKYVADTMEAPGRVTIKKALMIIAELAALVGKQHETIKYLLKKDEILTENAMKINITLSKRGTNEDKLTAYQNGLSKPSSICNRVTPNVPQIKKNVDTDQDFIP